MNLRDAAPRDRAAIHALVADAFGRADEADLVDRLIADGDAAVELVAEERAGIAGRVLSGHILFSRLTAPFPSLCLAPVSVAPARQDTGIGAALVRAGLDRAARNGWRGVFVLGDPAYYGRFGFAADAAQGFDTPYAGPYLMAVALNGPLPSDAGTIAYPPAFANLS